MKKPSPRGGKPHRPQATPSQPPGGRGQVVLSHRGSERWENGHPWIYQSDVEVDPATPNGSVVGVVDGRGRFLGQAFFSRHSKITLRWLSFEDEPIDEPFFRRRIAAAEATRHQMLGGATAYRAIHSEGDLLPGLVVDRYGEYLSVQLLTAAAEQRKELFATLLWEQYRPKAIVNRSDVSVRTLEGLTPEKGILRGELTGAITYREGEVTLGVDLLGGQKTGAFLDQRENHLLAGHYAQGEGLDCFSYTGGFALQLAKKCRRVTAVEMSAPAAEQIRANASLNQAENLEVIVANAFDFLRDAADEGKRFDTVVIDPPSFAKNKASIDAALRGYKELNLRAFLLLNPGGTLITASCSHHVDEPTFERMLEAAAKDAKRRVQILERSGAGKDHPVLLGLSETRYLKCFVLRAL